MFHIMVKANCRLILWSRQIAVSYYGHGKLPPHIMVTANCRLILWSRQTAISYYGHGKLPSHIIVTANWQFAVTIISMP